MIGPRMRWTLSLFAALAGAPAAHAQQCPATVPSQGAPIAAPLPVFPADNWWNTDISAAPVDGNSASFIAFLNNGGTRKLHPDFGGEESPGSTTIYGFPYAVVDGSQPLQPVTFDYWDESDGVNPQTGAGVPFYPIPAQAISQAHWVEGGSPASVDERNDNDRHLLVIDCTHRTLYELYNVWYSTAQQRWYGGSGAFFDMTRNDRRPDTWTSADAAGLAIFPGLVRYDEAASGAEINHAFRVTVRTSNGHVYPASHTAGSTAGALPMGARLRLKTSVNGVDPALRTTDPMARGIFRAMQKYGLIVADNGSDMYISGTFDVRWNNGTLNPAFSTLSASDFEVVQRGWKRAPGLPSLSIDDVSVSEGQSGTRTASFAVRLSAASTSTVTVSLATSNGTAQAGSDYVSASGSLSFAPGQTARSFDVVINGDLAREPDETFLVTLSNPVNATLLDAQATGRILTDDARRTGGAQRPVASSTTVAGASAVPTTTTPVASPRPAASSPPACSRWHQTGLEGLFLCVDSLGDRLSREIDRWFR
ncbi:hypothetical protein LYSHEL_25680 [Lysobacter helvus]|uniref:Calx-beta domain-containing protein n=3 Tax=Lysobacterales TaxID=135614 RepID=A0ABN6FV16_9GAMM|nr:hypothetical protein LYSCAS_25680 [Lysobacter caseinilyticus]BCT96697.1 hypothetical protein LYSHEL_25680 [Lysobacter helvus]